MWVETKLQSSAQARAIEQVDTVIENYVQVIYESGEVIGDWSEHPIYALVFEVEAEGATGTRYGYRFWLDGIDAVERGSGSISGFYQSMLGTRPGLLPADPDIEITVQDLTAFLEQQAGSSAVAIRRYVVAEPPAVQVVPVQ